MNLYSETSMKAFQVSIPPCRCCVFQLGILYQAHSSRVLFDYSAVHTVSVPVACVSPLYKTMFLHAEKEEKHCVYKHAFLCVWLLQITVQICRISPLQPRDSACSHPNTNSTICSSCPVVQLKRQRKQNGWFFFYLNVNFIINVYLFSYSLKYRILWGV